MSDHDIQSKINLLINKNKPNHDIQSKINFLLRQVPPVVPPVVSSDVSSDIPVVPVVSSDVPPIVPPTVGIDDIDTALYDALIRTTDINDDGTTKTRDEKFTVADDKKLKIEESST